jgi:hypothetical protein
MTKQWLINLTWPMITTHNKNNKNNEKQAGAELCQAQEKLWLAKASNKLRLSFSFKEIKVPLMFNLRLSSIYVKIEVIFHFC